MRSCFVLVLLCLLAVSSGLAQEKSIRPGINERWEKPDMAAAAVLLEQEYPSIYTPGPTPTWKACFRLLTPNTCRRWSPSR